MQAQTTSNQGNQSRPAQANWVFASLVVAIAALAGSLWLSLGLGLKACPLCLYQRTFVMAVVAVLIVGALGGRRHEYLMHLLALPLAVAGLGVAAFHEYLELTGKLECPAGLLAIGTAPQQSLAILAALAVVISARVIRGETAPVPSRTVPLAALVLGLAMSFAAVASAPPMPAAPAKAYETPLDMCRPPFE